MFDDQLKNSGNQVPGSPPPNLPFGEPDDMLAGVDPVQDVASPSIPPVNAPVSTEPNVDVPATALDAGVLKPVQSNEPKSSPEPKVDQFSPIPVSPTESISPSTVSSAMHTSSLNSQVQPPLSAQDNIQTPPELPKDADYSVKGPTLSRGIMTIVIILVILLIIGGGGFWVYQQITGSAEPPQTATPPTTIDTQQPLNNGNGIVVPSSTDTLDGSVIGIDDQVLFGAPVDSDSDGLDDDREEQLDLDPNNWDTDGDSLSDGDEVLIWKTNPKDIDTDGDGYIDGTEVKSGYNPNGPGRIFAPPTTNSKGNSNSTTPVTSTISAQGSVSAQDFGIPFTELGSCDQEQLNSIVLQAIQNVQAQGYVVDEQVANNPEVFALLTAEMEEGIRVCGIGPGNNENQ